MKKILFLFIILLATVYIHCKESRNKEHYFRSLVCGSGANRIPYIDCLRLFATLMVVLLHSIELVITDSPDNSLITKFAEASRIIPYTCNPTFFFISGALLLGSSREESLFSFYKNRLIRVLIPAIVYFFLYQLFIYRDIRMAVWPEIIVKFFTLGEPYAAHFWVILDLLIVYVEAPVLKTAIQHMSSRMLKDLVITIFLLHTVFAAAPELGLNARYIPSFAQSTGLFIVGYYLTTEDAIKHYRTFLLLAFVSLAASIVLVFFHNSPGLIFNNSPLAMCIASAIFLFFRKHASLLFRKTNIITAAVCKYSFSILMIHIYVLLFVIQPVIQRWNLSAGILKVILYGGITLTVSFLMSFVFDNTLVLSLQRGAIAGIEMIKRHTAFHKDEIS